MTEAQSWSLLLFLFVPDSSDFQPLVDEMLTATLTPVCQSVTILGDIVVEDNETFNVTASVDAPNTVTSPATATVTITDDDCTFA